MTSQLAGGVGLEVLPDWTPSNNPRLARFDAVIKVAVGARVPAGSELQVRLIGGNSGGSMITIATDIRGLVGPSWWEIRGSLVDIEPNISAVEGELAGCVSRPVYRKDATTPVSLTALRDTIGLKDEPLLWWRYYNSATVHVEVQSLRAQAILRADGRSVRLSRTYNGPAQLPPRRAMSGLLSAADLQGLFPGTYRLQLIIGNDASQPVTATVT